MDQYISFDKVAENLGVARITVWRWVNDGRFPRPVRLGQRRIAFRQSDIRAWEATREPVEYAGAATEG